MSRLISIPRGLPDCGVYRSLWTPRDRAGWGEIFLPSAPILWTPGACPTCGRGGVQAPAPSATVECFYVGEWGRDPDAVPGYLMHWAWRAARTINT